MPYRPDFDHVVRILESGVDIVTTLYMLSGWGNGDDVHDRVVAAADTAARPLLAGGIYPGHTNNVAMALSAMCPRAWTASPSSSRSKQLLREREDVPGDGL